MRNVGNGDSSPHHKHPRLSAPSNDPATTQAFNVALVRKYEQTADPADEPPDLEELEDFEAEIAPPVQNDR